MSRICGAAEDDRAAHRSLTLTLSRQRARELDWKGLGQKGGTGRGDERLPIDAAALDSLQNVGLLRVLLRHDRWGPYILLGAYFAIRGVALGNGWAG